MGIPLVIIQFTWIFRYKPSILGYPHYIIYIYTLYIYIIFTGLKPSTPTSKKFAFSQVQGGLWSQQIFFSPCPNWPFLRLRGISTIKIWLATISALLTWNLLPGHGTIMGIRMGNRMKSVKSQVKNQSKKNLMFIFSCINLYWKLYKQKHRRTTSVLGYWWDMQTDLSQTCLFFIFVLFLLLLLHLSIFLLNYWSAKNRKIFVQDATYT